jgi:shikimate dehydrogenase
MRFGIIGDPVDHSLSPSLFKAAYGGKYPYDLIQGNVFATSWQRFLDDYDGINITAPFKEDAFRSVDILSPGALRTGAVNLAVKTPRGIEGHNTDIDGVTGSVRDVLGSGSYPSLPKALIIGCGGAGRAAVVAMAEMGYSVALLNRTSSKADALAREMDRYDISTIPASDLKAAVSSADLIIYTASGPLENLGDITAGDWTASPNRPAKILLEAAYRETSFNSRLRAVMEAAGCRYVSGKKWLLHQAVAGYGIFTGEAPDMHAMAGILQ